MIHAELKTAEGLAVLCDAEEADIDSIVEYWHSSTKEYLIGMGADPARLGTPGETRARYLRAIRSGDPTQPSILFSIKLDGTFAGFSTLNQYDLRTNYSHWHIVNSSKRRCGISTVLYPHRIKMYFDTTNMERLIHQTRPENIGVNAMLEKFIRVSETSLVEKPDGMGRPGVFNIRYVHRHEVENIFEIARRAGR
jgi:hypothetical protein